MNKYFYICIIFICAVISSCTEECEEPDIARINALHFEFKQGGEDGFDQEALNQLFFVRYVPMSEPLIADTFYPNGFFPEGGYRFIINDTYPFRNEQSPYFTVYAYQAVDLTTGYVANIENIQLAGFYDGECGYTNTLKQFVLNGDTINRSGSTDYYLLTR